jgi:biopolymer transport protein ExbB
MKPEARLEWWRYMMDMTHKLVLSGGPGAKVLHRALFVSGLTLVSTAALAQSAPPEAAITTNAMLPHDLSPWGMFISADIVVQGVMIGLAFASVVTWTVWLAKTIELLALRRKVKAALDAISSARSLEEAVRRAGITDSAVGRLLEAAVKELQLSSDVSDKEGIKERVASRLERIEAAYGRRIARGTNVLATIGATGPFVGLFGTVWGIMNSFIGISKSHTTSLAVVAPGIAEALLATALGLVAAIPAVVIYNLFARMITSYRALLGDASAEVLRLVSRDLDRHSSGSRRPTLSAAE